MGADNSTVAPPDLEAGFFHLIRASGGQPEINLRSYALAAVAAGISCSPSDNESPEIEFLINHLNAIDPGRIGWMATLNAYLDHPAPADAPLIRLAEEMGLLVIEMVSIALASAVEDDVMVGRALARIQAPLGGSRPTLGLLAASFSEAAVAGERPINSLITGAA